MRRACNHRAAHVLPVSPRRVQILPEVESNGFPGFFFQTDMLAKQNCRPAGRCVFSRTRKAKKKKKPLGMAGKRREGKRNSGHCWASLRVSWLASRRPDGETTRCQLTKPRLIRRTISIGQTRLTTTACKKTASTSLSSPHNYSLVSLTPPSNE